MPSFLSLLIARSLPLSSFLLARSESREGLFVAAVLHDPRHSITWEEYRDGHQTIAFDRWGRTSPLFILALDETKNNLSDQIILLITELAGAARRIGANPVGYKLDQPFPCLGKNSFPIKSSSSHFPNDSHSFFFPQPTSLLNSYPSFFVSRPKRSLDRDNVRGSWLFILFPMPDICGDTFQTGNSI